MAYVTVKTDKAIQKLKKLELQIRRQGDATVTEMKDLGKYKAKSLVPVSSGRTYDKIRGIPKQSKDGMRWSIIATNYAPAEFGPRRFQNFNLTRWMHETRGIFKSNNPLGRAGTRHIKSGDPVFMYTTRDYLNRIKKNVATGRFKNINVR